MLNVKTGRFHTVPEYPEFAWQEGIVNAVTHREYGLSGSYIKVSMYDDRLEIESPGKLPSIVTVSNIRETRYARNSRISRVLTDFGWVKELNEGVARIYKDMEAFFLDAPVYSEPGESVKLVLYNNIVMRTLRQKVHAAECIGPEIWDSLDSVEQVLLTYLVNHGAAKRQQLSKTVSLERIIETHMETAFLDEDGHAIFAELEMPDSDIEKIKKAIKATLSEKELKLYIALFEEKKTLDEAARLLNISKDAARMRGKRLEIKIREMVLKYI